VIWYYQWWIATAFSTLFIVMVLGVLETSISFDNAIVNTTVLRTMNDVWRQRFLTWGILIAVVGMRIIFPLLIVSFFGSVSPIEALRLAIRDADSYASILDHAHVPILWFGGAFLMMVWLRYFFSPEKHTHWIWKLEHYMQKMHKMESIEIAIVLSIMLFFGRYMDKDTMLSFLMSGIIGLIVYVSVDGLASILQSKELHVVDIAKSSAASFLYLEILDASFSLDGVVGAFALSKNLFVIALWLGIGAYFVRSMTIYLYEQWTLTTYKYLENGAFWAICILALLMFLSTIIHVPEILMGLIGIIIIGLSILSSLKHKPS
jgi:hypothetical protein